MKMIRTVILFGTLAVFLYLINTGIMSSERNIDEGRLAYLQLAPVDPRSLIQGDYMILDYAIERDIRANTVQVDNAQGQVVLTIGNDEIASFTSLYTGQNLADNQFVINYRQRNWQIDIGVDSFFFQEGQADDYARAEYAEVRLLDGGGVMLIDLVDDNLEPIIPE